jgi:hypothetical protein
MEPAKVTEDYYAVLELTQTATREQVIRSYKQLALKLHPDRNPKHDATQAFQLVCVSFLFPLGMEVNFFSSGVKLPFLKN